MQMAENSHLTEHLAVIAERSALARPERAHGTVSGR